MKNITTLLIILLLSGCKPADENQTIIIDDKYSISIPSFLTKVHNLHEDAPLQYQHSWREFYIIALDESKADIQKAIENNQLQLSFSNDLKGYSDLVLYEFEHSMSDVRKTSLIDTLVNNMPAKLLTMSGRVEDINGFYSLAYVEGKERYYQIIAWTLSRNEDLYKDKMNEIMYSLKEF